jgi:hypothetical protein
MVGNGKLVITNIMNQLRPKTWNPSWKLMFPASPVTFRLKRSWQTFFALQWSQQRSFQIFYWVFFREVMVGNGKLVITNFLNQPRPKTRNPSWKLMFPASPVTFRLKRSWQTFFALQWSQQSTSQIFYWVFFREVMVGNGKLVITNFMNQPRPKTRNPSWKLMVPASPVMFRLKRSWQTFFALQRYQQRTFQIFYWVFFGEVMVGNGKLVITNFMNQPRPKTRNSSWKLMFTASPVTFRLKRF